MYVGLQVELFIPYSRFPQCCSWGFSVGCDAVLLG